MIGTDFERINVITNLSAHPTKKIQLDNQISLSYSDRSRGGRGNSGQKIEGISVDPNTHSSLLPGSDYIKDNLLETLNNNIEKNLSYSLRYNLVLDYEIIRNMHLKVSGGLVTINRIKITSVPARQTRISTVHTRKEASAGACHYPQREFTFLPIQNKRTSIILTYYWDSLSKKTRPT